MRFVYAKSFAPASLIPIPSTGVLGTSMESNCSLCQSAICRFDCIFRGQSVFSKSGIYRNFFDQLQLFYHHGYSHVVLRSWAVLLRDGKHQGLNRPIGRLQVHVRSKHILFPHLYCSREPNLRSPISTSEVYALSKGQSGFCVLCSLVVFVARVLHLFCRLFFRQST